MAFSPGLLSTKYRRPPARPSGRVLARPRLLQQLEQGLGGRLILISAPAGSGKTTLLSEWLSERMKAEGGRMKKDERDALHPSSFVLHPFSVAWVSLDAGDNDPVRFWSYVTAAIEAAAPGLTEGAQQELGAPQAAPLLGVVTLLANGLAEAGCHLLLVLDDYHVVTNPAIHDSLTAFLDGLPHEGACLVIATRTDPFGLPLARLRGRGQLSEIRAADLRFTSEEAATYLTEVMGLAISAADVARLDQRTEGWIAGLQMAALSMGGRADIPRLVEAFSGSQRYILDYFTEEVLGQQPEHIRAFLLQTSILEQFNGRLCEAVTGRRDAQAVLEHLDRANLFLVPLDDERQWYRYHHLFSDLLGKQLGQAQPGAVPDLHRRASQWYEAQGMVDQAIHHALAAGDGQSVTRLVDAHAEAMWARGESVTLVRWIEALPEDARQARPELGIGHVMVLADNGRLPEAERALSRVEAYIARLPEADPEAASDRPRRSLRGLAALARAWIAELRGDYPAGLEHGRRALEHLANNDYAADIPWRSTLYVALSNAHLYTGELAEAIQDLAQAAELGRLAQNHFQVLTAVAHQAMAYRMQGQLNQAVRVCRQGLQYMEQKGLGQLPAVGGLWIAWGLVQCERGELAGAEAAIEQGLALSRAGHPIPVGYWACQASIRLWLAKGDLDRAEEHFRQAERLTESYDVPAWLEQSVAALKTWLLIRRGRLQEAGQALRAHGIQADGEIRYPQQVLYVSLGRLCLAQGDPAAAEAVFEKLAEHGQATGQAFWLIAARLGLALVGLTRQDVEQAKSALRAALALAEPEGYVQVFLDEGEPVQRLLRALAHEDRQGGFVRQLLLGGVQPSPETTAGQASQAHGEPLSEREREVLRLLADGLSNREIAARLYLSVRTVKFHTGNLYGKLGVGSRPEAVALARRLGLLPP